MVTNNRLLVALWHFVILVTMNIRSVYGTTTDVYCLKSIKESIGDPLGYLSSWDFRNISEGSICTFRGVDCWHADENKVLNLRLSGLGLTGLFPSGVENCSALTGLDLSHNTLTGFLPFQISQMLKYVTTLDLSSNKFSGNIPESLANCTHLIVLRLNDNQLNGQIPPQLGRLGRLRDFSVANNYLQGQIPAFINLGFGENSYKFNAGLCGAPLEACQGSKKIDAGIIAGFISGAAIGMMISISIVLGIRKRMFSC